MKKFTVSEDVEIVANGQRILLEKGDKIIINEEIKHINHNDFPEEAGQGLSPSPHSIAVEHQNGYITRVVFGIATQLGHSKELSIQLPATGGFPNGQVKTIPFTPTTDGYRSIIFTGLSDEERTAVIKILNDTGYDMSRFGDYDSLPGLHK
jgi:hypothetical protein